MKRFPSPGALTGGLLTLALLPAFWPGGALAQDVEPCTEEATDLIAGQTTVVGDVNVCNDGTTLTVTYEATGPWCLLSTDLHVATIAEPPLEPDDNIPQTQKGNPKPDEFAFGDVHDCEGTATFEILLEDIGVIPGDTVVVAAHAEVDDRERKEGAWGDGTRFVEDERRTWAMYFFYTVEERCGGEGSRCVFVTSTRFTGDLVGEAHTLTEDTPSDGLVAGDLICQFHADEANLEGTYKAWLSTSVKGNSAVDRFTHAAVPYRLVNGTLVADDFDDLTSCTDDVCLQHPINRDETDQRQVANGAWTGTMVSGGSTGFDCDAWAPTDLGRTGSIGAIHLADPMWTDWTLARCSGLIHLYCVQQ